MDATEHEQEPRQDLIDLTLSLPSIDFPDLNNVLDQYLQKINEPKSSR